MPVALQTKRKTTVAARVIDNKRLECEWGEACTRTHLAFVLSSPGSATSDISVVVTSTQLLTAELLAPKLLTAEVLARRKHVDIRTSPPPPMLPPPQTLVASRRIAG